MEEQSVDEEELWSYSGRSFKGGLREICPDPS